MLVDAHALAHSLTHSLTHSMNSVDMLETKLFDIRMVLVNDPAEQEEALRSFQDCYASCMERVSGSPVDSKATE